MIRYSVIVPVKNINDYIRESVPKILACGRADVEIIIYPDIATAESWPQTRQISSGVGGPAMKRSLALRDAVGEVLVFLDDDAYPAADFFSQLDVSFANPEIVAVGGPAVTPANDSFWQRVSGAVFLSRLTGGAPERYVPVGQPRWVDDWPSVNLSIHREIFRLLGGFDSQYWPGEDTKLCLDLVQKLNKRIWYDPKLIAYHHRRFGLIRHLKQVGGYGLHRGFFAKKYPATSRRLKYFLPSIWLATVVFGGLISIINPAIALWYMRLWGLYVIVLVIATAWAWRFEHSLGVLLVSIPYSALTHLVYGWRFLQGWLFTRQLVSKLR